MNAEPLLSARALNMTERLEAEGALVCAAKPIGNFRWRQLS